MQGRGMGLQRERQDTQSLFSYVTTAKSLILSED